MTPRPLNDGASVNLENCCTRETTTSFIDPVDVADLGGARRVFFWT